MRAVVDDPNPWSISRQILRQAQQAFLDAHHVAISPFRFSPQERWKWEQGIARIREGEMRMKAERMKRGDPQ